MVGRSIRLVLGRTISAALRAACLLLLLVGCQPSEAKPLRIAVLPILDALPLYVAEAEGYFAEQGVAVEFVPVASAAERDQLLQAGQVDGVITDLVALALYNRDEPRVAAVRYAMTPTSEHAQFRILAAPNLGITTPDELHGAAIGVSKGTVIEYVTQRLLAAEGISAEEVALVAVPKIPDRMALLTAGELTAATLPEPLASLAMQQGAVAVIDDTLYPGVDNNSAVSCSIYAFRQATLEAQPAAVRAVMAAVQRASAAINAEPSRWQDLLVEKDLLPQPLAGAFPVPHYPGDELPTPSQFQDVVRWLQTTGALTDAPTYEASVTTDFVK
jgi:NitT/TauT family transport system substrate-binding protein